MKCAIFLALIAFASATPLIEWGNVGSYPSKGLWGLQLPQKNVAYQVAHQVTGGALHDQVAHTNEAINNLQWQLQQYPHSWTSHPYGSYGGVGTPYHHAIDTTGPYGMAHQIAHDVVQYNKPSIAVEAIQHLQDDMLHQQHQFTGLGHFGHPQGDVIHQLHDTIEVGVETQLNAGDVAQGVNVPIVSGLHTGVFETRLQKLVDEHNVQEIEIQISHHHHWAQQLHEQQEFVSQQKHQIEAQQALVQLQIAPQQVHHLEQLHHQLQMQEYNLIQQQLAHHLVILQLQKALIHTEQQVLQDAVAEHIHEQAAHGPSHPFWKESLSF